MKELLISSQTALKIDNFMSNPSHAVLVVGTQGIGKRAIAEKLAENLLNIRTGTLIEYPYVRIIEPIEGKAIGIDNIRDLDHFLSLVVPTDDLTNRIVLIDSSHLLTLEAQNAILKMLEEPPKGTIIILIASNKENLLPTIRSRVQAIQVTHTSKDELVQYFAKQGYKDDEISTALNITGGLPGLMTSILNQEEHPLTAATKYARELLSKSQYERMLMVDSLSKDKQLSADIVFIIKQMAHMSLLNKTESQKWQKILKACYDASESFNSNGQPKLTLGKLMMAL